MLDKKELEKAIQECEDAPVSFDNAHKLATLYNLYDRQYSEKIPITETYIEEVIGYYGNTDFYKLIDGKQAESVWQVMNELMETLEVINPRLYEAVLRKLK